MYVLLYTYLTIHIYICMSLIFVFMYKQTHIYAHTCLPLYMYTYIYTNLCIHTYIYTLIYASTYTHACQPLYPPKYTHSYNIYNYMYIYGYINKWLWLKICVFMCIHTDNISSCKTMYMCHGNKCVPY